MTSQDFYILKAQKNDPAIPFAKKEITKAFKKNGAFFGFKIPFFEVRLLYERKEMNKAMKQKTPTWMVGTTFFSPGALLIFSPTVFETVSSHKKTVFPSVLTHELAHLFIHTIYPLNEPSWLLEGIACFVASQGNPHESLSRNEFFHDRSFLSKLSSANNWQKNANKGGYQISFHWIDFLIQKSGREKLFQWMNEAARNKNMVKSFQSVYNHSLNNVIHEFFKERR